MIPEIVNLLRGAGPVGVVLAVALQIFSLWVIAKRHRRVRLKTPQLEIEAHTAEEVERLMQTLHEPRACASTRGPPGTKAAIDGR